MMIVRRVATLMAVLLTLATGSSSGEELPISKPRPLVPTAYVGIGPFLLPANAPEGVVVSGIIEDDAPSQFLRVLRARPGADR